MMTPEQWDQVLEFAGTAPGVTVFRAWLINFTGRSDFESAWRYTGLSGRMYVLAMAAGRTDLLDAEKLQAQAVASLDEYLTELEKDTQPQPVRPRQSIDQIERILEASMGGRLVQG